MVNETKEKCFIITPIGEKTDPIRRHIDGIINEAIIPALSDKYEVKAAHHISEPGTITKQVIDAIYNSKLVVANLTGRNPNVMYELALRHAIGKPVIMIVEEGTKIPSDIVMQRIIPYFNDAMGTKELRDNLKKAESEISFDEKTGPIVDVLGDISHDADMLQKVAAKNSDSMEPLEYILQRLDRIENSIPQRPSRSSSQSKAYIFYYTYSSYNGSADIDIDWNKIYEISEEYPWVTVHSTEQSGNGTGKGTINIDLEVLHPKQTPQKVADWFIRRLTSMGFVNVRFVDKVRQD